MHNSFLSQTIIGYALTGFFREFVMLFSGDVDIIIALLLARAVRDDILNGVFLGVTGIITDAEGCVRWTSVNESLID